MLHTQLQPFLQASGKVSKEVFVTSPRPCHPETNGGCHLQNSSKQNHENIGHSEYIHVDIEHGQLGCPQTS